MSIARRWPRNNPKSLFETAARAEIEARCARREVRARGRKIEATKRGIFVRTRRNRANNVGEVSNDRRAQGFVSAGRAVLGAFHLTPQGIELPKLHEAVGHSEGRARARGTSAFHFANHQELRARARSPFKPIQMGFHAKRVHPLGVQFARWMSQRKPSP